MLLTGIGRAGVMRSDKLYSRFIRGLRVVLPLAALALLSTIFMLSNGREAALDLSTYLKSSDGTALETGIGGPTFAGDTENGDRVIVRAARVMPDDNGQIGARDVRADLVLNTGGDIAMTAATAAFADDQNRLDLTGAVEVTTSTGYVVKTESVQIQIDRIAGQTTSAVEASGPVGQLRADQMRVTQDEETGDVQLHFTGNVKLVYLPQSE